MGVFRPDDRLGQRFAPFGKLRIFQGNFPLYRSGRNLYPRSVAAQQRHTHQACTRQTDFGPTPFHSHPIHPQRSGSNGSRACRKRQHPFSITNLVRKKKLPRENQNPRIRNPHGAHRPFALRFKRKTFDRTKCCQSRAQVGFDRTRRIKKPPPEGRGHSTLILLARHQLGIFSGHGDRTIIDVSPSAVFRAEACFIVEHIFPTDRLS